MMTPKALIFHMIVNQVRKEKLQIVLLRVRVLVLIRSLTVPKAEMA